MYKFRGFTRKREFAMSLRALIDGAGVDALVSQVRIHEYNRKTVERE